MAGARYHHLVPQTYMSAWANNSGTLKVEYIRNPGIIENRNKDNIAGVYDYHSIIAGMPICTASDAATIFKPVSGYRVECDGKILNTPLDLNAEYNDFDNWIITRPDGTAAPKKRIHSDISKIKIKDIEVNWSTKYENSWNQEIKKIEQAVLSHPDGTIAAFDKDYLMRFFVALDWRGFQSNNKFENVYQILSKPLDTITIPSDERSLRSLKTAKEEIRHLLLLKYYREFLADSGTIYNEAKASLNHTSFNFLVSDGPTKFITSDSPAFQYKNSNGQLADMFPITPRILMMKRHCNNINDPYYVTHVTDATVIQHNDIIRQNAFEFVIHPY